MSKSIDLDFFLSFFHLSLFVSSGAKQCEGLYFRGPFWHHLGDFLAPLGWFWAPFGDQLGAKGLPKSTFLAPSHTKNSKNGSQNEASKNVWKFDWNLMKKMKFWMCSSHRTIMYKGILVVGAFYERIKKIMKKWCQKGPKIDAQIDILAIRGPTFEILGHVFWKTFSYKI